MVGFGSSLRMARRPGWENAYLDYETLKLLLSQIEAVYEEQGQGVFFEQEDRRDYRDELFLESDSDEAYDSPDSESDRGGGPSSSSDDEDFPIPSGCGGAASSYCAWTKTTSAVADNKKKRIKKNNAVTSPERDIFFMNSSGSINNNAFFLAGREGDQEKPDEPSILSAPVRHTFVEESSALLPSVTPATPGSSLFTFARSPKPATPPVNRFTATSYDALDPVANTPPRFQAFKEPVDARRRQERHQRRQKKRRKNQVPRHIRAAHAKARAITERFLGLLRAETEKVMLFAQSRLGELADTAGSLRFPVFDEEYGTYSDGGMHPSASSSSEEGFAANTGIFPWSDSSDDEDKSRRGNSPVNMPQVLSTDTVGRSNLSSRMRASPQLDDTAPRNNTLRAVRRQMARFAELRENRPLFERNDQILGEDMFSAVEEADGYTAVGAELLHVLRYISVNLIAVRKICRKHDRLLMNRMLGGYYNRRRLDRGYFGSHPSALHHEHAAEETLGGLVKNVSSDVYEDGPALLMGSKRNAYKLVGVFDRKIQVLANSRTVQVVSSCLALALSEYEISRSRADAMTRLNSRSSVSATPKRKGSAVPKNGNRTAADKIQQPFLDDDDVEDSDDEEAPSTASSISLTRLQFAVTCIHAMREAVREKQNHFSAYLSRSTLAFRGHATVGEGLDGCSRESLDFLVAYNPDAALLLDTNVLFEGLKRGLWREAPVRDLFLSSIAASMTPEDVTKDVASKMIELEESLLAHAVNISPKGRPWFKKLGTGQSNPFLPSLATDFPAAALRLSQSTNFLFMMNYFVVHAQTTMFVVSTGAAPAYAATIIGAPNLSAVLVAILHCSFLSGESSSHRPPYTCGTFRLLLILSALFGVAGNVVHALAVNKTSVTLAVFGRFLFGFSSTDILQRELLGACQPSKVVPESARLVRLRVWGIVAGLSIGALVESIPMALESIGVRSFQSGSWLLMTLWIVQLVRLLIRFRSTGLNARQDDSDQANADIVTNMVPLVGGESDESSTESDPRNPSSMYFPSEEGREADISATYSSLPIPDSKGVGHESYASTSADGSEGRRPGRRSVGQGTKKSGLHHLRVFANRIRKLLKFHVGIPVSFFTLFFTSFAIEAFFTGTPIIVRVYFNWSGVRACLFLVTLALCILPIHLFCERISRRFEERTVVKRSTVLAMVGMLVMFNWESMYSLASRFSTLFSDTVNRQPQTYDWALGAAQYLGGFTILFVGITSLEGATLSLLSKISPPNLRSVVINVGTIVTFVTLMARLFADVHLSMVGLSHKVINTDMVNALVVPIFFASFVVVYLVRQNFFFLL